MQINNITFIVIILTTIFITYIITIFTIDCNVKYKINYQNNPTEINQISKKNEEYIEHFDKKIDIENRRLQNIVDDIKLINKNKNKSNDYYEELLFN
tara:strand:- start:1848 stop:2138 length:291 start_codon:yes stop_codon:yes gene_type:complete